VSDVVLAAPGLADAAREHALLNAIAENAHAAAACESKLRFLAKLLVRAREPAIVFTEYRDTLARSQAALGRFGVRALTLHGGQPPSERAAVQRQFNVGGSLLLATDAAAEGLNLQARCRVVIHYELPWTPARLEQRTGRVDRIGQQRRVHEILLVARDTAERMVLAPLAARAARARITLDGRSRLVERLTESRVAAAVMDGLPLTDQATPEPGPAAQTPWAAAAAAEAERLRALRRLPPGCLHHAPDNDVLVCAPDRHALRRRLTAVYASELVSGSGRVEHADMVAARMFIRPVAVRRSVRALKAWVSAWLREAEPGVRGSLAASQHGKLAALRRRFEQAARAVEQRERDIASARPSAARELVQAGLFERRALRAADARRRLADEHLEAVQLRRAESGAGLSRRLRLLAVILQ
jgi:hypothetical protein